MKKRSWQTERIRWHRFRRLRLQTANYNVVGEEIETQVFSNTKVTATGSDDNYNWSYNPLKYWDAVTFYRFVAYWPHTSETPSIDEEYVSHNETNHIITLRNLPCWQEVDSSNDWLIRQAGIRQPIHYPRQRLCAIPFSTSAGANRDKSLVLGKGGKET